MIRTSVSPALRSRSGSAALLLAAALALVVCVLPRPAQALLPSANASGEALYQRECAPCHGPVGHGDGPEAAIFRTQPRDLGDLARAEPMPRIVERVRRSRLRMLEIDEDLVVERRRQMVEDVVGYLQRMPDVPWPQVRRGADVYAERCEKCHGPNGRPVPPAARPRGPAPDAAQPRPDFQKAHGDAELIVIARGQGHPAIAGFAPVMSEDDATALLAYLRLLSNGFVGYSLWCAGCHGDAGRADGPLATGIDLPPVVFDRAYLSAQSPDELRRKAMHPFTDVEPTTPHFARNLSEGQTRAVLAALRVLQAAPPAPAIPQRAATMAAAMPATTSAGGAAVPAALATALQTPASAATPRPAVADAATPAPPAMAGAAVRSMPDTRTARPVTTEAAAASTEAASTPVATGLAPPASASTAAAAAGAAAVRPASAMQATLAPPKPTPSRARAAVKPKPKPTAKRTPAPRRTPVAKKSKPAAKPARPSPSPSPPPALR